MFKSVIAVFSLALLANINSASSATPGLTSAHESINACSNSKPYEQDVTLSACVTENASLLPEEKTDFSAENHQVVAASSGGFSFIAFLLCSLFTKRRSKSIEHCEDNSGHLEGKH